MLRLDINLLFTIINLLVLYFLMKKFLFGPVNNVLKKRKDLVDQKFADANLNEENALKMKDEYETALKSVKDESEKIVADAKERARNEHDKIIKETELEAERMLENARQNIAQEQSRALRKMQADIVGLAIAAAAKIVGEKSSEESNQKLYDQFLTEAGELNESKVN